MIYSSSFSKTIAPGRSGRLLRRCPASSQRELEATATATYITPVLLAQATVFEFVSRGAFEPNLERVRGLLGARRDAMLEALGRELGGRAEWSRPEGGYFLWLDLGVDTARAAGARRGRRGDVRQGERTSSSRARRRARRPASPSATSRRTRSPTASRGSRRSCRPARGSRSRPRRVPLGRGTGPRGTSVGCVGGASAPRFATRNVGQTVFPARAQSPARRK